MTRGVPLKGDSHCPGVWSEGISIPGVISIEPGAPVSPAGLYLSVPVHFLLAVTAGLSPEVLPPRGEGGGGRQVGDSERRPPPTECHPYSAQEGG